MERRNRRYDKYFYKRSQEGFHKNLEYNTGSFRTHNLSGSISGADKKNSYYLD